MQGSQRDNIAGLKKVILTVKEGDAKDSASTNWDVAIVDDEAKYNIECGRNEKKCKFRHRFEINSTATLA